jgi:zinc protease
VSDAGGLRPRRTPLDNGLVVLACEAAATAAVAIHASVAAGARLDPASRGGAAHFVTHVIDRGTRTRTADELAEVLDERGVALEASADRRDVTVACTCLADDFDDVLELVGDVLTAPVFDPREVEGRRGEILTELRQDEDDPAEVAETHIMAELYGAEHPYGRPVAGTRDSVQALEPHDLERFHGAWFAPSRTTLAVVGAVSPDRAADVAARVLGGWAASPAPDPDLPAPAGVPGRRLLRVPVPGKAQAEIAYGLLGLPRRDADWNAAWLMIHILGQYALGGRLGDRIREREGMAYHAYATLEADYVAGPLVVAAGVDHGNVDRTIAAIDEELRRFLADGPTAQEVDESRQYLVGALPRMLETNAGIAALLQTAEAFGLGLDYDTRIREQLAEVRVDDVHAVARRLLDPDRAAIVVAG